MNPTLLHLLYGLLLLCAGMGCGLVNTLASSGSAISLPVLLLFGLSPLDANATNRLSVLFGSLTALRTFQAKGVVNWRAGIIMSVPAVLGSVAGVLVAERVPARSMGLVITAAILMALILLVTKLRSVIERALERSPRMSVPGLLVLLVVGFWLGFIALDGATYLLLVLMLIFHYDLVHANALKVLLGVTTTLVPIAMFASGASIHWTEGLVMAAGSAAGGYFGAKLTMHERAKFWIYRILIAVLLLEIVHLAIQYGAPYFPQWFRW